VSDVGDDGLDDLIREAASRCVRDACLRRRSTEQAIDAGFASTPNDLHASREVYPYGANGANIRDVHVHQRAAIPDTEDVGPFKGPALPVVGGFVIVAGVRGASR
jgi:hypothetical protein